LLYQEYIYRAGPDYSKCYMYQNVTSFSKGDMTKFLNKLLVRIGIYVGTIKSFVSLALIDTVI